MESFKIENLSFKYPGAKKHALQNISLSISQGEFICICGKSGCGKTTLLKLLKPCLSPFGEIGGSIFFNQKLLFSYSAKEQAAQIGFVMQNPENQLVCDKVWHELAFGLESLGIPNAQIKSRVAEMAAFFGIDGWFHKNVAELSGGQKQILSLASVMLMQPSVLILDEPSSQLDPIGAQEFFKTLEKINRELGTTVILSEHRLGDVLNASHRVVVMDSGKIIADQSPKTIGKILKDLSHPMQLAMPAPLRVYTSLENGDENPITVGEGRLWLEDFSKSNKFNPELIPCPKAFNKEAQVVIEIKDAYFRYDKNLPDVIKGLNMQIKKGELFAIMGGNGAGKTTALSLISAINKPQRGEVFINSKSVSKIPDLYENILAVLWQNPQLLFVKNTLYLDLAEILLENKLSKEETEKKIKAVSELCKIEHLLSNHPYDLSGGEQQRAALAKVLLKEPKILLLDEPTKGMDAGFKKEFAQIINSLKKGGVTVVMVSHDIEFCAEFANRCALFFDGGLCSVGTPREFFAGNNFYTTSANRMARSILPNAVLAEDIILAFGKETDKNQDFQNYNRQDNANLELTQALQSKTYSQVQKEKRNTKKTFFSLLLILLTIPLTIYIGTNFFGGRKYLFISLAIIFQTFLPFLLMFESRKPQAREIVLISVLCAMAVASRCAFFMLPQFKPFIAIIIVSAACLGAEAGFLIGAQAGFASNFFFGQGPWTPWQMFALGIIGFLGGLLFKSGTIKKTKPALCIFGFLASFLIYGGIMNPASVIMMQNKLSLKMIVAAYGAGLPFDFIQSLATALFMWFISKPIVERIERIKIKYGLISR